MGFELSSVMGSVRSLAWPTNRWFRKILKKTTKVKHPDLIHKLLGDQPEKHEKQIPKWLEDSRKKR